jgi:hypothetical protein
MSEDSYYKQLKSFKQSLKGKGWTERIIEEEGKRRYRWSHPSINNEEFSLNGAMKADTHREVSEQDIERVKETINTLIDVVSGLQSEVNYLKSVVDDIGEGDD